MVFICPYFYELNFKPLRYFKTGVFQRLVNRFTEYNPSVFGRAYKMVQKYWNIMALMNIFTHITKIVNFSKQSFGELTPNWLVEQQVW